MGRKKDERPGYHEFFYDEAGEAVYKWLLEFCQSHPEFCLGTCNNGKYRVVAREEHDDLSTVLGRTFCLFRTVTNNEKHDPTEGILDVYGIDVSRLFMISGTLNCFNLVFRDGSVYSFDDGTERGVPGLVRISCVNDRDLMMQIYEQRNNLWALELKKERIPLAFDHFLELLRNMMTDDAEWLEPEVHEDGSIDLIFATLYGHHTMFKISPNGRHVDYVHWSGTKYEDQWQPAFEAVIELTDLPVYKKERE